MNAKIITYDTTNGTGILITTENEKRNFNINDLNDFDILPEVGLLVDIDDKGTISVQKNTVNLNEEKLEKLNNIKNKYINGSIANGWRLINNNDTGFVIQETVIPVFMIILYTIFYTVLFIFFFLVLFPFLHFWALLLSLVLIALIDTGIGERITILKGVVNKEKFIIEITKEGKPYKLLSINKEENINYNNEPRKNNKLKIILISVFIIFTIGFFIIQNYFIEIMDYINMKTNLN